MRQVTARIKNAERKTKLSPHEARIVRRRARLLRNEVLEELEGQAYQVGGY